MTPTSSALLLFRDVAPPGSALSFTNPVRVVSTSALDEVPDALAEIERLTATGLHAVGYIAYEAGPAFDPAMAALDPGELPLLQFALYHSSDVVPFPHRPPPDRLPDWQADTNAPEHAEAVTRIRAMIAAGDVYQVNYTTRFRASWHGDGMALLMGMHQRQRGGYTAWLDFGRFVVASASPELFVSRRGDVATTRPMKGTAPRGRWAEEDAASARLLADSGKERAENVMIVDLLRNDLGRLAVPGTVRVPRLFEVERYPSVWQMTSTIEAVLPPGTPTAELIGALFPCGSITGAPKVAAARVIAELERSPRGVYCGIVGHMAPGGDATFAVAIRTATFDRTRGTIEYGSGGGITWDSAPAAEHAELLAKAAIATSPWPRFDLLETMRLERGVLVRVERHLARLERAADRFDVPFLSEEIGAALESALSSAGDGTYRVRLLLGPDGTPRTELHRRDVPQTTPITAALAREPVSREDVFLYYKTTHRTGYERRRAERPELDEVLLRNAEGELTEFTNGNLILEIDGVRLTPPRGSGLLDGVFRAELLETGAVAERVLYPEDLARASAIWLVNSVREWVPVRLTD